jgi:hypothetical protein
MRDLVIRGDRIAQPAQSGPGIKFYGEGSTLFDRIYILQAGGHGMLIQGGHATAFTLRSVRIESNGLDGIYGRGSTTEQINAFNLLHSEIGQNLRHGVNVWPTEGFNVKDCVIQGNAGVGLLFDPSDDTWGTIYATARRVSVEGNYLEANAGGALRAKTSNDGAGRIRYLQNLNVENNLFSQFVADAGVTAIAKFEGAPGSAGQYLGLLWGRNTYGRGGAVTANVDFGGNIQTQASVLDEVLLDVELPNFDALFSNRFTMTVRGPRPTDATDVSEDRGNVSTTLYPRIDARIQRWATALTANRTVTLDPGMRGDTFRIVRTGLGAFTLDVGPGLKVIPSATAAWVDVAFDGAAWVLTGYGTL